MKMNRFVLALASILLTTGVSAATVPVALDRTDDIPAFIHAGDKPAFEFKTIDNKFKPEFSIDDLLNHHRDEHGFNPHDGFDIDAHRDYHAALKGTKGIEVARIQVSAVPLPAAVWLFVSGLAGMMGFIRRKKRIK
ncbi:MAG: VPLPA-CTERM sorting domain-containing protein [Gammaproteobacteria bacterium]|nr:VPLPA-CTERM sorting domain-containing protein [Gammaproteobacteria bacterium]